MIINQVFRLLDDVEKNKTGTEMFEMYIHSVMMVFIVIFKKKPDSLRKKKNKFIYFNFYNILQDLAS